MEVACYFNVHLWAALTSASILYVCEAGYVAMTTIRTVEFRLYQIYV